MTARHYVLPVVFALLTAGALATVWPRRHPHR
jgi:hypothetical protein